MPDCHLSEYIAHKSLSEWKFEREYFGIEVSSAIHFCKKAIMDYWDNENLIIFSRQTELALQMQLMILRLKMELGEDEKRRKPKKNSNC